MSLPSSAYAHVGVGPTTGFLTGLLHPLTGLDHIGAMVGVGLWAAQRGGRALWLIPLTFVGVMALGGLLGTMAIAIPFAEQGIVVSVLSVGVLVAAAVRLPLVASVAIVGPFAIFHGHAHGTEMPLTVSGVAYGLGFLTSTASLHLGGLGLAATLQNVGAPRAVRFAGASIAACGAFLLFGSLATATGGPLPDCDSCAAMCNKNKKG